MTVLRIKGQIFHDERPQGTNRFEDFIQEIDITGMEDAPRICQICHNKRYPECQEKCKKWKK